MILITEMLASAVQQLDPRPFTLVTVVTTWLEMRLVSANTMENGVDMHQSAVVSSVHDHVIGCVY